MIEELKTALNECKIALNECTEENDDFKTRLDKLDVSNTKREQKEEDNDQN